MNARATLTALLAIAVACGGDSVTDPTQGPAELTQVLMEMDPSSVSFATAATIGVPMVSFGSVAAGNCSYAADSRSFICPTVTSHGLTVSRSFTLLDASGAAQSAYDRQTTDGVRNLMSASGTIGPSNMPMTIDDHSDMTLTGLLSGRHVLNGVRTTDMSGGMVLYSAGSSSSNENMRVVSTTHDLVLPGVGELYPKSGTITMEMTSDVAGLSALLMRTQMTFNGTSRVDVTTTSGNFTTHCTIDLSSRLPFCV